MSKPLLVTTSSVLGHLACWAVRQSPYPAPDNMREAMEQFAAAFPSDPEMTIGDFRARRWDSFGALYDGVWASIEASPAILAWNVPKSGHDAPFVFSSRYDQPCADDDFIDLHALCRNVTHSTWREAVDDSELDSTPNLSEPQP